MVVSDYNARTAEETVEIIKSAGGETIMVKCDVSKEEEVKNLMQQTFDKFGRLDSLFSNAGIGEVGSAADLSEEAWDRLIGINLKGVFLCAKHAIPYMKKSGGGSIINNASILGHVGFPGAAAYNAAKGGVVILTKNLALDYAKDRIRVNAVSPGFIRTPMVEKGAVEGMLDKIAAMHPLGRLGEPIEVANCVLFLASEESSFVTGISLLVDGGYTAQ